MPQTPTKRLVRLSGAHQEIMDIIWGSRQPLSSAEILAHLTNRSWAQSTVVTALVRLEAKGYVSRDRSTRPQRFAAAITEAEYRERESREFLQRMHKGSISSMVAALNNSGVISAAEKAKLQAIIDSSQDLSQDPHDEIIDS